MLSCVSSPSKWHQQKIMCAERTIWPSWLEAVDNSSGQVTLTRNEFRAAELFLIKTLTPLRFPTWTYILSERADCFLTEKLICSYRQLNTFINILSLPRNPYMLFCVRLWNVFVFTIKCIVCLPLFLKYYLNDVQLCFFFFFSQIQSFSDIFSHYLGPKEHSGPADLFPRTNNLLLSAGSSQLERSLWFPEGNNPAEMEHCVSWTVT